MKQRFLSILLAVLIVFPCFAVSAEEWCEISLPSTLYGIVGKEINVYFDNVIMCNDLSDYQISVECSKGVQQERRWTYTPNVAEEFDLRISVFKNAEEVSSAQTRVKIKSTAGTNATKKVLCIGDSWTEGVYYVGWTLDRFNGKDTWAGDGDNIQLLGTKTGWNNEAIRHEGRYGWTTQSYCTMSEYETQSNPFYNSTSKTFDFAYYLSANNIATPDIVILFLGINDAGQGITSSQTITYFNQMINSIHSVSSNIKIGIVLTPPPAGTQDGFGKHNACGTTRFRHKYNAFNLSKALIANYDGKIDNVSVVPVNVNIDCIDNYQFEEVNANAYSTVKIRRQVDNVHPYYDGYKQVADSMYAFIKSFF